MSRTKCPKCGAGRGLADYDNGAYCHACSYKEHSRHIIDYERNSEIVRTLSLPSTKEELPKEHIEWLNKYYINKDDVQNNDIFYSPEYDRICFPRYVDGIMAACWLRSIKPVKDKWIFIGDKNVPYYYQKRKENTTSIAICEDIISGIRLSAHVDCLSLCGTNSSHDWLLDVFTDYGTVICFLDGDQAGRTAAEKFRKRFKLIKNVRIIRAHKDPKEFSPRQLGEILNERD